ncbi:MAG TPA: sodium:solute symporter family protein [Planctomycetota bacterium]|nr:sodium:solute symporter family protein [Planctomycetota bacterium]
MPPNADSLGILPHVIVGLYLLMLLGLSVAAWRRSRDSEVDYYLAGREQGWLVSSLTIMATFFSSYALLGAPGMAYRDGVVFALFSLNVPFAGACIYVLGSRIRRLGVAKGYVTPADMICDYYGSSSPLRVLVAAVGVLYTVPYVVLQIHAGGILSQQMFPGAQAYEIGTVVLALITMAYVMVGGMRSVAWTDTVQGFLLMLGMLVGGAAAVAVLGGPSAFLEKLSSLPHKSLSVPGTTGAWTPAMLFTVCVFGAVGSMLQPAQWMRYYAARSTRTLRRGAVIFAVALTACYLFGVMLVGLGGQALYPLTDDAGNYHYDKTGQVLPNPAVGDSTRGFDNILVVVIKNHVPALLGKGGAVLATLIFVAIMAAAMSTSDSNLHATSALLTRDVYDRFIRPGSSQHERTWVGRLVIAGCTLAALALVFVGRHSARFNAFGMIIRMGLLAIAFASQLIPVTIDILFVRRGTRKGAEAGTLVGILIVLVFSPLFPPVGEEFAGLLSSLRQMIDVGTWGLLGNVCVFALVSLFTRGPDRERVREFAALMTGEKK